MKSTSKVRIEGTIGNKSCSTTWVDPKTVFEPYPDSQISPFGPRKAKNNPDLGQKRKLILKEAQKEKVFSALWVHPKTVFENYHGQKISTFGFRKSQSNPKIMTKSNVRIKGNLENKVVALYE